MKSDTWGPAAIGQERDDWSFPVARRRRVEDRLLAALEGAIPALKQALNNSLDPEYVTDPARVISCQQRLSAAQSAIACAKGWDEALGGVPGGRIDPQANKETDSEA